MRKLLLLIGERIRLLCRGARAERAAVERWKQEHRRLRDAATRFVTHALGEAPIYGWQTDPSRGTIVVVGLARSEWVGLLETIYGSDHPVTEQQRHRLMEQGA